MRYRLTEDDRQLGPLRWGPSGWSALRAVLSSGKDEDGKGPCVLTVSAFGWVAELQLPRLIEPHREWVDLTKYEWARSPGYWDQQRREYGFSFSFDGFFSLYLGRQTDDSSTTQDWHCFLPWTQWRHVRHTVFGVHGGIAFEDLQHPSRAVRSVVSDHRWAVEQTMQKDLFVFLDFDGEAIAASVHSEERQWKFGTGWLKWLSLFRKDRVRRSLDIEFSREVGREKGSWKGRTIGHSIEMLPGESNEQAFRRYCTENNLSFIGEV